MAPYSSPRAQGAAGPHRTKILAAVAELMCERAGRVPSVADTALRAGVSIRTFNLLFDDPMESVVAAFEDAVTLATHRARAAAAFHSGWLERVGAVVGELLSFADEHPQMARVCVVYARSAGERLERLHAEQTRALAHALADGAPRAWPGERGAAIAMGLVSCALATVRARMLAGEAILRPMRGELLAMIVRAYTGAEAVRGASAASARRDLHR
jgi:AcrR family transcriptional regulator